MTAGSERRRHALLVAAAILGVGALFALVAAIFASADPPRPTLAPEVTPASSTVAGELPPETPVAVGALTPCQQECNLRAVPDAVRRPLALPTLPPGQPCPVTTGFEVVSSDLNAAFGDGPVRIVGISADATLSYTSFAGADTGANPYWGGQKVVIASAPGTGPALLRGRQLDGRAPVGFGNAPYDELHQAPNPGRSAWASAPTFIRIQHPGCYGIQVDTPDGTTSIVFHAAGPAVDPPAPAGP